MLHCTVITTPIICAVVFVVAVAFAFAFAVVAFVIAFAVVFAVAVVAAFVAVLVVGPVSLEDSRWLAPKPEMHETASNKICKGSEYHPSPYIEPKVRI